MSRYILSKNLNNNKNNVSCFSFPLGAFSNNAEHERRIVIFLGEDFRNLPGTDLGRAMRISNQCLNYIRRECKGCELYYKPHPTETDEHTMLNLEDFIVMKRMPVEVFYMKHADEIRHVFSTCSLASRMAYDFGLNSSLFLEPIAPSLDPRTVLGFRELFSVLPAECFINNFSQPLRENKKPSAISREFEKQIQSVVAGRHGTVWMLIGDPNALPYAKVVDASVKKYNPDMSMHLVISWHHRWETMPMDEVKQLFDSVSFIPRPFYSLRPEKLLRAWRTARQIQSWPVGREDIIVSRLGLAFTDDCFASYFSHIQRIALMPKDFFDLACGEQRLDTERYRRRLGAIFFNRVMEPVLGIKRTHYFEDKRRIANVYRYQRPLNDIFDHVWVY
ncbi:MAG: hypothetical protein HY506_02605 [Candidatus Yanofskybacteria bacterium]|nr:hypothetical protein [Candidatus Yanofskybacteria bacterium]